MSLPTCLMVCTAIVLIAGCSKSDKGSPETPKPVSGVQEKSAEVSSANNGDTAAVAARLQLAPETKKAAGKAQASAASANSGVVQQEVEGEIHPFMTTQLRQFIQDKGRIPSTFSEFTSARMDSVPFAPAGKKYVIDAATQTVKIVKK